MRRIRPIAYSFLWNERRGLGWDKVTMDKKRSNGDLGKKGVGVEWVNEVRGVEVIRKVNTDSANWEAMGGRSRLLSVSN